MAKPKLALIPAAQGTSLYSVLPSSGVGDFDFTRSGSATRINSQGLIETVASGVSRLNYPMIDGVVKGCPHHILEPQRSNLITYSEDFSNASWSKNASGSGIAPIVTSNQGISPDGALNADRIQFDLNGGTTSADLSYINSPFALGTIDGSFSIYLKTFDNTTKSITLRLGGTVFDYNVNVTSEWQRFDLVGNTSVDRVQILLYGHQNDNNADLLVWGAQLEQGSYATSYIPNYGTSGGVTRSAETASGSGDAATFNDSEGVLMAEVKLNKDSINKRLSISNGSTLQRVVLWFNSNNTTINAFINGGETVNMLYVVQNLQEQNKYAFKYKENDCSLWVNGIEVATDLIATMPSGLSELAFDDGVGGLPFYGNVKQLQYFDTALTDSELEKLTSWVSFTDMAEGQQYTIE